MELLTLTDKCLRHIFRRIPLVELIPLRIVSHSMKTFVEKLCAEKRALKLFFNPNKRKKNKRALVMSLSEYNMQWEEQFRQWWKAKDNVLVLSDLGNVEKFVNFGSCVAKLFPNVENLVVVRITEFVSKIMFGLFAKLSTQLTGLTLIQTTSCPKSVIAKLMTPVNSLEALKRLHLFEFKFAPLPKRMPIFAQLEELTLDCYFGDLYEVLRQLGPNLRHFRLGPDAENYAPYYRKFGAQNPRMASRLTHLSLGMGITCSHYVNIIAENYPNLTYLDASAYLEFDTPLGPIFSDIAKLKHLKVFKIDVAVFDHDREEHDKKDKGPYSLYKPNTRNAYPQMGKIKSLHLYDWEGYLNDFKHYDLLAKVFVNLDHLYVFSVDFKGPEFSDKVGEQLRKHFRGMGEKIQVEYTRLYWKYMHTNRA